MIKHILQSFLLTFLIIKGFVHFFPYINWLFHPCFEFLFVPLPNLLLDCSILLLICKSFLYIIQIIFLW